MAEIQKDSASTFRIKAQKADGETIVLQSSDCAFTITM